MTTTTHPGLIKAVCADCATLISMASTHGPLAGLLGGVAPGDVAGLSCSSDYTAHPYTTCVTCGDDERGARTHVRLSGPVPFIPGYVEVPAENMFTAPVDDVDLDADHLRLVGDVADVADVGDGHESLETLAAIQASHRYEAANARTKAIVAELWAEVPAHDPEETTTARALAADEWSGFMSEMFDSSEEL